MINNFEKILKIIDDLQGDDRLIASPKVCYGIMEIREIIEASNSEKPNSSEPKQADFGFMDDTISRREALALIRSFRTPYRRELNVEDIYDAVLHMPSAQPERTGKWIFHDVKDFKGRPTGKHFCKCNQCEKEEILGHRRKPFNYCPNCGARMEGDTDD